MNNQLNQAKEDPSKAKQKNAFMSYQQQEAEEGE